MAFKIPLIQSTDRLFNQLQLNIKQALEPLFASQDGTFVATLTGCTTTPTAQAYWQQAASGGQVTVAFVAPLVATSNLATATITGLPKAFWPTQTQYVQVPVTDNGVTAMATAAIDPQGVITLYKGLTGTAFTASGTKGLYACSFTYVGGI